MILTLNVQTGALEDFDKVKHPVHKGGAGGDAVTSAVGGAGTEQKGSEPQDKPPVLTVGC